MLNFLTALPVLGSTRRTLNRTCCSVVSHSVRNHRDQDDRAYSLAQRSALANGDLVTFLNTESRGDVGSEVLVAPLVSGVLGDEVEVFAADDEGSVHLGGDDGAGKDTAADGDLAGEGALLVCKDDCQKLMSSTHNLDGSRKMVAVSKMKTSKSSSFVHSSCCPPADSKFEEARTDVAALNGGLGGTEPKTNVLVPSPSALADALGLAASVFRVHEDMRLLLESTLALDGQFGGHGCDRSGCDGYAVCGGPRDVKFSK